MAFEFFSSPAKVFVESPANERAAAQGCSKIGFITGVGHKTNLRSDGALFAGTTLGNTLGYGDPSYPKGDSWTLRVTCSVVTPMDEYLDVPIYLSLNLRSFQWFDGDYYPIDFPFFNQVASMSSSLYYFDEGNEYATQTPPTEISPGTWLLPRQKYSTDSYLLPNGATVYNHDWSNPPHLCVFPNVVGTYYFQTKIHGRPGCHYLFQAICNDPYDYLNSSWGVQEAESNIIYGETHNEIHISLTRCFRMLVKYTAAPTTVLEDNAVSFSDVTLTENTKVAWLWDFGDGYTTGSQNPSHVYTTPGIYYPTLTITDNNGDTYTTQEAARQKITINPDWVCDFTYVINFDDGYYIRITPTNTSDNTVGNTYLWSSPYPYLGGAPDFTARNLAATTFVSLSDPTISLTLQVTKDGVTKSVTKTIPVS